MTPSDEELHDALRPVPLRPEAAVRIRRTLHAARRRILAGTAEGALFGGFAVAAVGWSAWFAFG